MVWTGLVIFVQEVKTNACKKYFGKIKILYNKISVVYLYCVCLNARKELQKNKEK